MFAGNQGQSVSKACIFKIGIFNVVLYHYTFSLDSTYHFYQYLKF